MPGWKSVQSKKKLKQKTKLAFIVLGLVIILLLLSQAFKFYKTLNSAWKAPTTKNYNWNREFNINLLIRAKNLSFLSYNPSQGKINLVDIPDQTFVEAAHSFGKWQARALFDLGGDSLLKDTMADFFGQPVDAILEASGNLKNKSAREIVDILRQDLFASFKILPDLKTDLTLMELIKLKLSISSVRFDKFIIVDLYERQVLQKSKLPDGTEVLVADPNKLDLALVDLADPLIKKEHKTIAILNATSKPLFAQKWARVITNIGGDVIITANAQKKLDKTIAAGEASKTLERLKQILNIKCEDCDKIIKSDEDFASSRGQINIKLAPDLN